MGCDGMMKTQHGYGVYRHSARGEVRAAVAPGKRLITVGRANVCAGQALRTLAFDDGSRTLCEMHERPIAPSGILFTGKVGHE